MSDKTLKTIAEAMRDIDFCMFSTKTEGGALATCPMSTNREVEYDGTSRFFARDDARLVADIAVNPDVSLAFQGKSGLLGTPPMFIAATGTAELSCDKADFAKHWTPGLDRWFPEGVDTPGLVMITVRSERVHYWDGEDEGEVVI